MIDAEIKVVFIGIGMFPFRISGDKNFQLELGENLKTEGVSVKVISISEVPLRFDTQKWPNYLFVERAFHFMKGHYHWYNKIGELIGYHHNHGNARNLMELTLTLILNYKRIQRFLSEGKGKPIVVWSDSAFMVPVLRWLLGGNVKLIAMNLRYIHGTDIANKFRGWALSFADAIIVGTEKYKQILLSYGCTNPIIEPISWGASFQSVQAISEKSDNRINLLWCGYIQQIQEIDFFRAVSVAQTVVRSRPDIEFNFVFKPESFRAEYAQYNGERISVRPSSGTVRGLFTDADALFSPVVKSDSSLAPPLTWIEAWAAGLPIVTTKSVGIEELIDGKNAGIWFETWQEMEAWLMAGEIRQTLAQQRAGASNLFKENYSMDVIAAKYYKLFGRVMQNGI